MASGRLSRALSRTIPELISGAAHVKVPRSVYGLAPVSISGMACGKSVGS